MAVETKRADPITGEIEPQTTALVPAGTTALTADPAEVRSVTEKLMYHQGGMFPKDMSQQQAVALAQLAVAYNLDPIAGDIILYQGRPYITITGHVRNAGRHPSFDGLECVPATDAERTAFRCDPKEHLWIARVWRKDRRFPSVGYGRAGGAADKNPISGNDAQVMAQKRAKHRALRDAFSLPLPGAEEQPGYVPGEYEHTTGPTIIEAEREPNRPAAIHAQLADLGIDDADYRRLLRDAFDVGSHLDLPEGQQAALLEMLGALRANAEAATSSEIVDSVLAEYRKRQGRDEPTQETPPVAAQKPAARRKAEAAPTAKPSTDQQAQYVNLMAEADFRGLDLAPFETDANTSEPALADVIDKLQAAINVAKGTQAGLPL